VIAAVGLEVAVDEGDQRLLVAGEPQAGASGGAQLQGCEGIGLQPVGVDAVVDDADAAAKRLRKTGGLPVGGADARGGKWELPMESEMGEAEEVVIAIVRDERNQDQEGAADECAIGSEIGQSPAFFELWCLNLKVVNSSRSGC
jgi:hypothetical protein